MTTMLDIPNLRTAWVFVSQGMSESEQFGAGTVLGIIDKYTNDETKDAVAHAIMEAAEDLKEILGEELIFKFASGIIEERKAV